MNYFAWRKRNVNDIFSKNLAKLSTTRVYNFCHYIVISKFEGNFLLKFYLIIQINDSINFS